MSDFSESQTPQLAVPQIPDWLRESIRNTASARKWASLSSTEAKDGQVWWVRLPLPPKDWEGDSLLVPILLVSKVEESEENRESWYGFLCSCTRPRRVIPEVDSIDLGSEVDGRCNKALILAPCYIHPDWLYTCAGPKRLSERIAISFRRTERLARCSGASISTRDSNERSTDAEGDSDERERRSYF
jgi:hypothetical protein